MPGSFAGDGVSATEKSRMCSSWIWASFSGTALGFVYDDQPAGASQVGQVDDQAARGVGGQGDRVRVGDLVGDDLGGAGRPDLHGVPVGLVLQDLLPVTDQTPVVSSRFMATVEPSSSSVTDCAVGAQTERVGRPLLEGRPEVGLRRVGVEVVEDAGDLHAGRGEHRAVRGPLGGDELAAQGLADPVAVARVDGQGGVRSRCGNFAFWASVSAVLVSRSQRSSVLVSAPSFAAIEPVRE